MFSSAITENNYQNEEADEQLKREWVYWKSKVCQNRKFERLQDPWRQAFLRALQIYDELALGENSVTPNVIRFSHAQSNTRYGKPGHFPVAELFCHPPGWLFQLHSLPVSCLKRKKEVTTEVLYSGSQTAANAKFWDLSFLKSSVTDEDPLCYCVSSFWRPSLEHTFSPSTFVNTEFPSLPFLCHFLHWNMWDWDQKWDW